MRAALAFALRRTSALLVFAVGAGGLVFVVYRAVRPLHFSPAAPLACGTNCFPGPVSVGSTHWDLAAAALAAVVAVVAAVLLYRRAAIGGHHVATFRAGRSRAPGALRLRLLRQLTSHGRTGSSVQG